MEIPPFLVFLVFRMSFIVTHYKCGMSDKQLGESCSIKTEKKSLFVFAKHTFLHSSCKKVRAFLFFFPPEIQVLLDCVKSSLEVAVRPG